MSSKVSNNFQIVSDFISDKKSDRCVVKGWLELIPAFKPGVKVPLAIRFSARRTAETNGNMANPRSLYVEGKPGNAGWHGLGDPPKNYKQVFGVFQLYKKGGIPELVEDNSRYQQNLN